MISCIRVLVVALTVGAVSLAKADGLSFVDAVERASREAPSVEVGALRVEAAEQASRAAGRLPDPKFVLGLDNLPVTGPDAYSLSRDSMTMRRVGLMQDFPNPSKRAAERALAQGQIALARSEADLARLTAQEETASAWIERRTLEQQLAQLDALDTETRLLQEAVRVRIASGQAMPLEAVTVRQETAALAQRRDALVAARDQAIARLRRWLGEAAEQPLVGAAPEFAVERSALLHGLSRHPALAAQESEAAVADAEIAAAKAQRHPDWSVELAYQKRAHAYGDMVSVQLTVDLPLFAGSRQVPRIEAARMQRRALDAERDAALREHQQMIDTDLADQRRLQSAVERQRDVVLPLATEKVALLQSAWRANQVSLGEVIAARRERIEAQLALLELEGAQQAGLARLHFRYDIHTGEQ